ncbi:HlyD family type I secretion periplasmic adaptor subunit [Sphingomonas psychrotolerans]|uniref:Membrane fusion protein (MFP) family protein n=1 Tax=Sphingomonas psychrotolerans TaxID=1327635 RepID=A0ABU3N6S7_9SPHN|nr:HlyD family type I secretion periplasmic adaptor subunit [Sphingomonas psychrotolerans]MDT8760219.1 HlyD family type I secretion periplasmic adaptor subunit [Sphingomonas psychrotolerans]
MLRQALREDRERSRHSGSSIDTEFLPAALEVIEQPVSPTARVVTWAALAFLVLVIAWAVFGRVDVVASAPGTLIPAGNVKLVQSPDAGVVRAIHVRNGDRVRRGQALLDLDPTLAGADLAQAEKALAAAELEIARNRAIADALSGKPFAFVAPLGTPPEVAETQRRLIAAQIAEVEATTASLSNARTSALSDARAARAQVAKLSDTVPLLDRQIASMNRLDAKGYAPGARLIELQRQRRGEAGERDVALTQITRGEAEARKLESQMRETREQARRTALTDLAKAEADAILRREEVTKARQRSRFQRIASSVDGTVQQLEVHTIGGVIEPAKPLMVIVPSSAGLEVEARVLNKDVGFVRVGQEASVKLEAFPFTRYGAVPGRVRAISPDAVQDKELGPVYVATILLDRAWVDADGRRYSLSPGLAATVDVRTGTRSIISYLLSPLQSAVSQAGRER